MKKKIKHGVEYWERQVERLRKDRIEIQDEIFNLEDTLEEIEADLEEAGHRLIEAETYQRMKLGSAEAADASSFEDCAEY